MCRSPAAPTLLPGCPWLLGLPGADDGTRRVNAPALALRQMFCVEELLLGRKGRGGRSPLFYYSEVHFNLHKRCCVCDG